MFFNNDLVTETYVAEIDTTAWNMQYLQESYELNSQIMKAMCEADVAEAYMVNGNTSYEPVYENAIKNVLDAIKKAFKWLWEKIKEFGRTIKRAVGDAVSKLRSKRGTKKTHKATDPDFKEFAEKEVKENPDSPAADDLTKILDDLGDVEPATDEEVKRMMDDAYAKGVFIENAYPFMKASYFITSFKAFRDYLQDTADRVSSLANNDYTYGLYPENKSTSAHLDSIINELSRIDNKIHVYDWDDADINGLNAILYNGSKLTRKDIKVIASIEHMMNQYGTNVSQLMRAIIYGTDGAAPSLSIYIRNEDIKSEYDDFKSDNILSSLEDINKKFDNLKRYTEDTLDGLTYDAENNPNFNEERAVVVADIKHILNELTTIFSMYSVTVSALPSAMDQITSAYNKMQSK